MGTISVSMSGARVFSWEGDERVVKNILEESPRGARGVGMEPAAMAGHGRPGQEMMMGVIWFLLGMNVYELALPPGGKLKGFS